MPASPSPRSSARGSSASQAEATVRWRSLSRPVQLLVINQFGINLGFYLVLPYLAAHLIGGIGLGVALVGLVLGIRTLAQQGMFLIGGTLADHLGPRPVIIAGCLLRVLGFGLFAIGDSLAPVVAASVLTGLAGALFNPAVRSYIAEESEDHRAAAFAYFSIAGNAGMLAGPLVGSLLIMVNFQVMAVAAAAIFAILSALQLVWLPARAPAVSDEPLLAGWWSILNDRRFLIFALAGSSLFSLQNQLYLVIPRSADEAVGSRGGTVAAFAVATVLAIVSQRTVTRFSLARWGPHTSIVIGLALMGAGFTVPMIVSLAVAGEAGPVLALGSVLVAVAALAVGGAIAQPFVLERIAEHACIGLTGTYYGVFYLISGVMATASSALVGAAMATNTWLPWLVCAALGISCAAVSRLRTTAPTSNRT